MGYHMLNGRFADDQDIRLDPLEGTLTEDGYSAVLELGDRAVANLLLSVPSVSASDTLDVNVECSSDGSNWYVVGSFTQVTGPATEHKAFTLDRFVRAHYNVGGSEISIPATLRGRAR